MTAPLVPAEVDLRGYEFMPLYGERLFTSETWLTGAAEAKVAMLRLWWHAYAKEVPAASLPNNDALLAEYAGYGVAIKAWRKVKAQVMRGFIECSDGRLYHENLAVWAIEAWAKRDEAVARKENERERQRRHRQERSDLFAKLRDLGIVPAFDAKTETLRETLQNAIVTRTATLETPTRHGDVTVDATAKDRTAKGQRSDSEVENRDVERTPGITAPAGDSHGANGKSARSKTKTGQDWDNEVWVAETGRHYGKPRHPNETAKAYRDRIYGVVQTEMREAKAETARRAR